MRDVDALYYQKIQDLLAHDVVLRIAEGV